MSRFTVLCLLGAAIGCGTHESAGERRESANTIAGKLGQAAHKATVQANKAGAKIGRELGEAAHDAHEGWKEDKRRTREQQK